MSIGNVPFTALTGVTVDTSALLQFSFWQKVYYKRVDTGFPSESTEGVGHIVGISEHCGNRVREAIASGMIGFYFITGDINPADILSKHWGYSQIWDQLKTLLFWKGDTMDIDGCNTSNKWGVTSF